MWLSLKLVPLAMLLLAFLGWKPIEAGSMQATMHEPVPEQLPENAGGYKLDNDPQGQEATMTGMYNYEGQLVSFLLNGARYTWDSNLDGYRAEFWPSGGTDLIKFYEKPNGDYSYEWTIHDNGGQVDGTATAL